MQEMHGANYTGTDDVMPEAFDHWMDTMDLSVLSDWAQLYGRQCYLNGKEEILTSK